jgi:hypothetical protein
MRVVVVVVLVVVVLVVVVVDCPVTLIAGVQRRSAFRKRSWKVPNWSAAAGNVGVFFGHEIL